MSEASNSSCSPFTRSEIVVVSVLNAASGFISLLASCFVVFLIVLFKKWKFFTQRLVLYLAISVALQSIAATIGRVDYNNETSEFYWRFCEFSAFLLQNASWMVLLAVSSITVYIFALAVFRKRTDRSEIVYLFVTFALPLLFNWIPFINTTYGKAGAWCWIRGEDDLCRMHKLGEALQFVLWYIPLYVILSILIGLYVTILIKIQCCGRNKWTGGDYTGAQKDHNRQMSRETFSLLWYPLIYFIINLFPLSLRIYGLVRSDVPVVGLVFWILTAIFYPIQGGFMAVAFTLDSDTRKRLKWKHVLTAAKELCGRSDKHVQEYPIEHSSGLPEDSTEEGGAYETKYRIIHNSDGYGHQEDEL